MCRSQSLGLMQRAEDRRNFSGAEFPKTTCAALDCNSESARIIQPPRNRVVTDGRRRIGIGKAGPQRRHCRGSRACSSAQARRRCSLALGRRQRRRGGAHYQRDRRETTNCRRRTRGFADGNWVSAIV